MTSTRLIYSAIIIVVILFLIGLDLRLGVEVSNGGTGRPGMVLFVCVLVLGLMAANEVLHFDSGLSDRGVKPWAVYCGTAVIILVGAVPLLFQEYPENCSVGRLGWLAYGMAAAVGLSFVSKMFGYRIGDRVFDDIGRTILIAAYTGLLFAFWFPIRTSYGNEWGMVALLSLLVTVKMSDAMAWGIGKHYGRHKLAPRLSPGKTIEGLLGGLVGGCIGALIVFYLVAPGMTGQSSSATFWVIVLFAIAVTAAGVLGDLAESLLKRDGGVKDSSHWLPGLGGITDMVDSLLVAGPVVLGFWNSGLVGPNI